MMFDDVRRAFNLKDCPTFFPSIMSIRVFTPISLRCGRTCFS